MNKKFSTLLVGAMLASAMSVGAQTAVQKYESGKTYLLGTGDGTTPANTYISVVSEIGDNYGKLVLRDVSTVKANIKNTNEALWSISVTPGSNGNAPKYVYVNKATGLTLSVNTTGLTNVNPVDAVIGGSASEWLNTAVTDAGNGNKLQPETLQSYLKANEVVYFTQGTADPSLNGTPLKVNLAAPNPASALNIAPYLAANIDVLTAEDLNTQLQTAPNSEWFNLSFNRDVTSTGSNLFANTALQAEDIDPENPDGWVRLKAKDKKAYNKQAYIVVDTAYHQGTEASAKLVKYTYANIDEKTTGEGSNKQKRLDGSYEYRFSYSPSEDRLLIWVCDYYTKAATSTTVSNPGAAAGSNTWWTVRTNSANNAPLFVRLVELTSVRELTVARATEDDADDIENGMLTKVTMGVSSNSYVATTLESGLYIIKLHTSDVTKPANGSYYLANLAGENGYTIASKQDFQHIPAAQWVVEKQGTNSTAPVKITNREFEKNVFTGQLFKAGNYVFSANGDTVEFIPVEKANKENKYLGYKHVTAAESSVETFVFNYLHGLASDKYLNTPAGKDSIVRVDEKGGKAQFVLVPVVNDDAYGYTPKDMGLAKLVRNVYYVKAYDSSKWGGEARYLTYSKSDKRYVMSVNPTPFFLKENNCVDGTHYYALVEANLATYTVSAGSTTYYDINKNELKPGEALVFDADGDFIVTDGDAYKGYLFTKNSNNEFVATQVSNVSASASQKNYQNGIKVSVDDASLDLTQGDTDDKFTTGNDQEIRTSAFAVVKDDSPLYRRFNGVVPGTNSAEENYGDAKNAPLNLKFFRYNNAAEFLAENAKATNAYRNDLKDNTISFLGVNNEYQFKEADTLSYTFHVDTAYVRYNTRMPQYMLALRPEIVPGDTIWCNATEWHHHATLADSLACTHTHVRLGFTRAMYLFNAQDSIAAGNEDYRGKSAYGADKYTRLAFVDAVHAQDTLYILKNSNIATKDIDLRDAALFSNKIALDNNKHKNVVFQFRLIDDSNLRFLIESETEQNGTGVYNADLTQERIAPSQGGWVKIQNGVPVIARFGSIEEALAQAEIFEVNSDIKFAPTSNDEIAAEGISIVAGDGTVTIQGAAGKSVVIKNILGKEVAATVLASDNATIAVPAGIVVVSVDGEEAVKAIVK